jgi:RNA polymerase sigma-70 factor (ECF subfamily)
LWCQRAEFLPTPAVCSQARRRGLACNFATDPFVLQAGGRLRSFERAVDEHQRSVFTFARYLLGNPHEAEDVTQEALIRMWKHWDSLDVSRLEAWLLKVTRNLCYDRLRRLKVVRRVVPASIDDETAQEVPAGDASPEERAHSRALRARLLEVLEELREPYKSAVILREVHGLSYQEISDALETPLNSIKVHVYRGRRQLRQLLKEEEIDVAAS